MIYSGAKLFRALKTNNEILQYDNALEASEVLVKSEWCAVDSQYSQKSSSHILHLRTQTLRGEMSIKKSYQIMTQANPQELMLDEWRRRTWNTRRFKYTSKVLRKKIKKSLDSYGKLRVQGQTRKETDFTLWQ